MDFNLSGKREQSKSSSKSKSYFKSRRAVQGQNSCAAGCLLTQSIIAAQWSGLFPVCTFNIRSMVLRLGKDPGPSHRAN